MILIWKMSSIAAGEAHSFLQISDTEIGEDGVGEWVNYLKDIAERKSMRSYPYR